MFDWNTLSNPSDLKEIKKFLIESRLNGLSEDEFFNPPHPVSFLTERFFDLNLFENIKKSKEIIKKAILEDKLIIIHGDYDADGVCATTILYQTIIGKLNYPNCLTLIPDRFEDGYGLTDKTVQKLLDLAFNQNFLLITVDCGISSFSQISYLKSLGNQVIVTDHHHMPETIPECDSIIWSDKVVGSTLSWFLSLGLGNKDPKILGFASIATVTDVFPLVGFNRSIIKHGLEVLRTNPPVSIETILDHHNKNYKEISVYDLGFIIGPRLNSSGRIGSADTSLQLLNSEDRSKAVEMVSLINEINLKRQKITEESLTSLSIDELNIPKVIIVYSPDFHEGVMGLIASKLVQKYNRPALVISSNEGKLKGSARSIKGINIIKILKEHSEEFISVGGHELAAGFSLHSENFPSLKKKLELYFDKNFSNFNFKKSLSIDSNISTEIINMEFLDFLGKMEPYGNGNEEPIFSSRGLKIKEIKFIGEKKNHLSLIIFDSYREFKALFFNFDKESYELYLGQVIDIAYKIRKNEYRGNISIDLNLVDIKFSNDSV